MFKHTLHRLLSHRMVIAALVWLLPLQAYAQGSTFNSSIQENVASIMATVIAGLNLMTWIVFLFLTVLLDPNFIFDGGDGGSLMAMLNSIWVLARDLMNVAFALILIGIAVYTVVTAKKDFATEHLRKLVLAIVLINFSWFIPRLILDVANVSASAVYGIPSLIVSEDAANACTFRSSSAIPGVTCNAQGKGFQCQCAMVTSAAFFLTEADVKTYEGASWYCPLHTIMCVKMRDLDINAVAGYSAVLNGLIVNHARLQSLATVPPSAGGSNIGALMMFLMREAVVLIIHVALLFPLAAMAFAFAVRIPVLWLTIAFMPFALLKFVVPSQYTGDYPQKIWEHFLKAAFLPAIVGIPLTIGFILINAGANLAAGTGLGRLSAVNIKLTDDISNFYELLWMFLALGVMWVGVFSVLEKMDLGGITAKASGAIKGVGQSIGGIAAKAPLSLPIIPGLGNPLALPSKLRGISHALSNSDKGLQEVLGGLKGGPPGTPGTPGGTFTDPKKYQTSADTHAKNTKSLQELDKHIDELTEAIKKGPAGDADKKRIMDEIQTKYSIDVNAANPESSLREYLNELKKKADATTSGTLTTIEQKLNDMKAAINKP